MRDVIPVDLQMIRNLRPVRDRWEEERKRYEETPPPPRRR